MHHWPTVLMTRYGNVTCEIHEVMTPGVLDNWHGGRGRASLAGAVPTGVALAPRPLLSPPLPAHAALPLAARVPLLPGLCWQDCCGSAGP